MEPLQPCRWQAVCLDAHARPSDATPADEGFEVAGPWEPYQLCATASLAAPGLIHYARDWRRPLVAKPKEGP